MALVLTVQSDAWNNHVTSLANSVHGLVPVVKGNGYGFGRDWLAARASDLTPTIAVGTIFEVSSVPAHCTPVVLTPSLELPENLRDDTILTVGSIAHIEAAAAAADSGCRCVGVHESTTASTRVESGAAAKTRPRGATRMAPPLFPPWCSYCSAIYTSIYIYILQCILIVCGPSLGSNYYVFLPTVC